MPLGSSGYDPFWMIRWPFSGNVNERITAPWFSPSLTVNYAGDARIEDRVVTEVASYGRQLGWLTEIALALANKQDPPPDTVRRLKQAAEAIEAIKREVQPSAIDAARTALDRLERDQPAQYERLLSERQRKRRTQVDAESKRDMFSCQLAVVPSLGRGASRRGMWAAPQRCLF